MDPSLHHENTDAVEPNLPKLRVDSELPRCKKSRTLAEDPNLHHENTDAVEPNGAKLRRDNELPNWTKSNTLAEEPKRAMP